MVPAVTVVWCAKMRASALTAQLPVSRYRLGRPAGGVWRGAQGH
jgi:NADH dehydrogenase